MKYIYHIDADNFFSEIKTDLFRGKFTQAQVDGINIILKTFDGSDIRHVAYALATVYHETAETMQPIEEFGKGRGYDYGKKLKMGSGPGKRIAYTVPNKIYYGRGYTQNTWYENYLMLTIAAKKAGYNWDFLNNPELLLQPEPSAWAMKYAMVNGTYTGRKLADYFNDERSDSVNARRVINGIDQAQKIARHYEIFYKALTIN